MINGRPKVVSDYTYWRGDLLARLGNYCCYCNMPLTDGPEVEHVQPKNPPQGTAQPGSILAWENLLLSCGACNRYKGNRAVSPAEFYLAEHHNTHLVFHYIRLDHPSKPGQKACIPVPSNDALVNPLKAKETIDLTALAELKDDRGKASDLRWNLRHDAWISAATSERNWRDFGHLYPDEFLEDLLQKAKATGFFSIWFNVFQDVPSVRHALIQAFPGTAQNCFDQNANPLPRNGTEI